MRMFESMLGKEYHVVFRRCAVEIVSVSNNPKKI